MDSTGQNEVDADTLKQHIAQIEEAYDETFEDETKWYSSDNDMMEYSAKYPDLVFRMMREGEDREDTCITYYKDGKMQECWAEITFGPYDPSKLK